VQSPSGIVVSLAAVCLMSIPANAQLPSLKIGDNAPPFTLNKVLQANVNGAVSSNELKDNVVVLEFWATWCVPCIPAIKHYNELSEKFKGKPVRFIAITDEDEMRIAHFIKTQPIRTWIGLDKTRATFDAYQATGLPHTVVIDRNGKIAAITKPENVTETVLNDLIDAKCRESYCCRRLNFLNVSDTDIAKFNSPITPEIVLRQSSQQLFRRPSSSLQKSTVRRNDE
jgi:thiol-disulfide isomerase/thioredoxin